ncbi:ABC transporter permease subunit [Clostridium sp. 19966]|uniref:ABC transporter permease n=1 Tax=Clostridium sp. 19966 TaxID=2768166 RepID=UPI0028DF0BA9|nr:ABC transporter permease subunit [Clostridium sp. 19966]MDT8719552.1 ABC transporter permease subunit [Clostridium sp. 19966]
MLTLTKYELFKLFKRKKTWVVIIAFILLTGLLVYGDRRDAENEKKYSNPDYIMQMNNQQISMLESEKNNIPENIKDDNTKIDEYKNNLDQNISSLKEENENLKQQKLMEQSSNDNWKQSIDEQIKNNETALANSSSSASAKKNDESLRSNNEQLKYLKNHDIKPSNHYDFNAYRALQNVMKNLGQLFLLIGVAVFVADMVSGEATPPTLKLLLTQPVSRGKVLLSKFLAISIAAAASILLVEIGAFIVTGIMYGFGNSNYPVIVGTQYHIDTSIIQDGKHPLRAIMGSSYIIPNWQYTLEFLGLQMLYVITVVSVTFMISSLVKSSMISMGISTVGFIAVMVLLNTVQFFKNLMLYIFLGYTDFSSVLSGDIAMLINKANPKIYFVVIVLLAWTAISYAISHLVFTKKDILV